MHRLVSLVLLLGWPSMSTAQDWDAPAARALAERATLRRSAAGADSALGSYTATARGVVAFLAQVGADLEGPPQLVKADELAVEVYWRAPGLSKQVIGRWRDGTWLPTRIHYHRDHLGIVVDNFGPRIRLGEGDEVRDVPHPLSPGGLATYAFRLVDSLAVQGPAGRVAVHVLEVRPHDFGQPAVLGELFIDAATGDLVRFRFGFTRAAYLDGELEDITVVLENTRWDERWWLPWRQEVEIRRRSEWLDFPARGIIRGRWEIGEYEFNVALPPERFLGPLIGGLPRAQPDTGGWERPLAEVAAAVAEPVTPGDLAAVRREVARLAGARAVSGLPANRLGAAGVSDLVRVNRVEGLALGAGLVLGPASRRLQLRPRLGIGTASGRVTGGLSVRLGLGEAELRADARREVRDVGAWPVISPLLNSVLAQVGGRDFGDWVLVEAAALGGSRPLGRRARVDLSLHAGRTRSLATVAEPFSGSYRPNPRLGGGSFTRAVLALERLPAGAVARRDLSGTLSLEAGHEEAGDHARLQGALAGRVPLGPGQLELRGRAGLGTTGLPAWRSFAIGGRGTLVGERYRAWGGRRAATLGLGWRVPVPVPALPLGPLVDTGARLLVEPFVAAGWAGGAVEGAPWVPASGARPVAGLALEWPHGLLRVEAGVALRTGRFGMTVDASRAWWGIL